MWLVFMEGFHIWIPGHKFHNLITTERGLTRQPLRNLIDATWKQTIQLTSWATPQLFHLTIECLLCFLPEFLIKFKKREFFSLPLISYQSNIERRNRALLLLLSEAVSVLEETSYNESHQWDTPAIKENPQETTASPLSPTLLFPSPGICQWEELENNGNLL